MMRNVVRRQRTYLSLEVRWVGKVNALEETVWVHAGWGGGYYGGSDLNPQVSSICLRGS